MFARIHHRRERARDWLAKGWVASVMCLTALTALPAAAASYNITAYGLSTDRSTLASDINNAGSIVGSSMDTLTGASTGFLITAGVRTDVAGPAGAISTELMAITDGGTILGNYSTTWVDDGFGTLLPGPTRIFSLSHGVYTDITVPGVTSAYLTAASSNGRWLLGNTFDELTGRTSAFAFDTVAGTQTPFTGNADATIAAGVNNLGVVVGYDRTRIPGVGFVGNGWTVDLSTGLRQEYQVAGSERSGLRDITDAGVISGYYYTSIRPAEAHGFTGLNGDFAFFDVPGTSQTFVLGANDKGALVGQYVDADGNVGAFLAVPVPEPGTAALLLVGLVGIGRMTRRNPTP